MTPPRSDGDRSFIVYVATMVISTIFLLIPTSLVIAAGAGPVNRIVYGLAMTAAIVAGVNALMQLLIGASLVFLTGVLIGQYVRACNAKTRHAQALRNKIESEAMSSGFATFWTLFLFIAFTWQTVFNAGIVAGPQNGHVLRIGDMDPWGVICLDVIAMLVGLFLLLGEMHAAAYLRAEHKPTTSPLRSQNTTALPQAPPQPETRAERV